MGGIFLSLQHVRKRKPHIWYQNRYRSYRCRQEYRKLFVNKETKGPLMQELLSKANAKQISISYVPIEKLNRLTKTKTTKAWLPTSPLFHIAL